MLKLEAIRAQHGDALLLHYGTKTTPKYALIDGGPENVFADFVRPRLEELGTKKKPVRLRWTNVSHVDEDHILGLIDLFNAMIDDDPAPAEVDALFHDSPTMADELTVIPASGGAQTLTTREKLEREWSEVARAAANGSSVVAASFPQGADLTNLAGDLGIPRNPTKGVRLLAKDKLPPSVVGPLKVTVVAPALKRFEKLIKEWRKALGEDGGIKVASDPDTSPANLSSIALFVENGGKTILLTGDVRSDHLLEGLEEVGLLEEGGTMTVDVLKVPHHGSDRSVLLKGKRGAPALLDRVKAKHYVISANGRDDNPTPSVLKRIAAVQGGKKCTIWMPTPEDEGIKAIYAKGIKGLRKEIATNPDAAKVVLKFPAAGKSSVIVPLVS